MQYTIGIEELVTNALIELIEQRGIRTLSFSQLDEYGDAIIAYLRKANIETSIIFNRDLTNSFICNCEDMLDINESSSDTQVTLKDSFSANDLRKRFRVNLPLDILKAFVSEEALLTLLA